MQKLIATALLLGASACFHFHYVTDLPPAPAPTSEAWHNGFVWGLAEGAHVDAAATCPSGFARIDSTETFLNGLVRAGTWGIYTPETITVTCSTADAGQIPQSPTRPWAK